MGRDQGVSAIDLLIISRALIYLIIFPYPNKTLQKESPIKQTFTSKSPSSRATDHKHDFINVWLIRSRRSHKVLLPWPSVLGFGGSNSHLGDISGGGFGLFLEVQREVTNGGSNKKASDGHSLIAEGKPTPLVQYFPRVLARGPLGAL